jgi:hypothetical protein
MYLTARQLVIILLIFSQGFILWQGVFASAKMTIAVDTEKTLCIQDDMTQPDIQTQNDEMDCDCCNQQDCVGFCYCHSCVHCSLGLISSVPTISYSPLVLISTFLVSILDGHSAQFFKPPRKLYS